MRAVQSHPIHGTTKPRSEPIAHDLAQALEQSGEAVIVKDLNAVVTYWNREAASLYGFSAEEAIGQPMRSLHAADLSEKDYSALLRRIRAGIATSSTSERRKKNGAVVRVAIQTTPLRDEQGAVVGEITIARDVTSLYATPAAQGSTGKPAAAIGYASDDARPAEIAASFGWVPIHEILIGLALLAAACMSIWFTQAAGGVTLFWPASAIAAALLVRLPRVRLFSAGVSITAALMIANVAAAQRPWSDAASFSLVDLAEIAMMAAVFRTWRIPYPNITVNQAVMMTAVFGIAIPGIAAIAGGLLLHVEFAVPFVDSTLQWWSSDAVGACLVGPPILLFSVKDIKRLLRGKFLAGNAATVLLCLLGCCLTIRYVRFPFVSLATLLLIAALRLGGLGAALMSISFATAIAVLWALGIRPIGFDAAASLSVSLLEYPVIALLATVLPPIAVGLDSDSRRATARALRTSERRFRASMEHSPIGMLIADLKGIWGYTNIALQQMLGYTAEEFRALPPGGPSRAEDWKDSEARWQQLLSGETDFYSVPRSFQHKDGHWIWTQVSVSLLRDEEGTPIHLIAQVESLEARRRAEDQLAEERERLRITLQSIDDAVITTDAQTRVTYINAAAESLLRLDMKAVQGRRLDEVLHLLDPQSSKAAANLIGQSALHGKVMRRERYCLLLRTDGTFVHVIDTVSPVMESTGLLGGMVVVFRDVTLDVDRTRDLRHRAAHDPLTGLANRAEFEQRLRTVFGKARHLDRPAAVIAIDLDRFKAVNDTGGHAAGDAMLCKVAQACLLTVRSSDLVARLGGDEFAVILDNCPEDRAQDIGRQLLLALNPLNLEWLGSTYTIGASLGLAMNAAGLADEKAWLEAADKACYDAKRGGRGRLRAAEL